MIRRLLPLLLLLSAPEVRGQEMDWLSKPKPRWADWVIQFKGSQCQASIAGTNGVTLTNTRNSLSWLPGSPDTQCSALQSRVGDLGLLVEAVATQYVTAPDAPTNECVSMPTGTQFHARMTGSGSVALSFGTATGTGLPATLTAAAIKAFTVSGAGTVCWNPSGEVTLLNVVNWSTAATNIHSAITRAADIPTFTTPAAIGNDYCIGTRQIDGFNGTFNSLRAPTGFMGVGTSGANRTTLQISQFALVTATFADSAGGTKTLTWQGDSAALTVRHAIGACRCADGSVALQVDGFNVGKNAGTGTGIASTTPPTSVYVGSAEGQGGPIWIGNVGINVGCTRPVVALDGRTRVAAIGDSITQGGTGGSTSYPAELGALLGSGFVSVNEGVGGNTTAQMVTRYTGTRIQDRRYPILIVLGGINSIIADVPVATIESELQSIYDAHRAQGGKLLIGTMLPWKGDVSYTAGRETNRQTVNTWIKSYATTNSIPIVDFSTTFDDGSGAIPSAWAADPKHPNALGYQEMAAEWYAAGHTASYW